jgi:probable F420-dependent oxidoreductase
VKLGVQFPEIEYEASWPQLRELAHVVEGVGLDSIWLGDHLLYDLPDGRQGPWECWSMLAALAAVTDRVQLGPFVAALPFHNPAILAKKAATVDEVSGGRLVFGVGAGWNRFEFEAFGLPYQRRVDRFAEAFTILHTLLTEGAIDFAGEFYTLRECELSPRPRPGGPPLMVGSTGARMLSITLPYVQSWNGWYEDYANDVDRLGPLLSMIDEATVKAGRSPDEIEKTVAVYLAFPDAPGRRTGGEAWTGSVEEIAARLAEVEDAGVHHVQAVLDPIVPSTVEKLGEIAARLKSLR